MKQKCHKTNIAAELSYIHKNQSDFAMNLEETENRSNLTFSYLNDIEKKKEETENRNNLTFSHFQKQIDESTELGKYYILKKFGLQLSPYSRLLSKYTESYFIKVLYLVSFYI